MAVTPEGLRSQLRPWGPRTRLEPLGGFEPSDCPIPRLPGEVVALQQLGRPIDYLLVDGFLLPEALTPKLPIVKGDRRSISIMCGGILAKVTRDRLMRRMAEKFPGYGFEMHKGYPTPDHLAAMDRHGLSPLHRRSFISIRTRAELEAAALASQIARD